MYRDAGTPHWKLIQNTKTAKFPRTTRRTDIFFGNVVKVRSKKEEIDSNMETGGERIEFGVDTEGDRIGYNVETKEMIQKNVSTAWRGRKKGKKCTSCTRT